MTNAELDFYFNCVSQVHGLNMLVEIPEGSISKKSEARIKKYVANRTFRGNKISPEVASE